MSTLITGGTGFIGSVLVPNLVKQGHEVFVLSRSAAKVNSLFGGNVKNVKAITELREIPVASQVDLVINLAGEPIADKPWTAARKAILLSSRIDSTKRLVEWMGQRNPPPKRLVTGSAVGYYGDQGDREVDELTLPHDEFAHQLCAQWEAAALDAARFDVSVVIVRTGLVIGREGGFLKRMLLPFRLGLGGRLGDGEQWMPWIHREDLVRLVLFLADHSELTGAVNGTAPHPVTNREFTQTLAAVLHRPAIFPVPAFVLKLLLGEMSALLLGGQKAMPKKALAAGFIFQYPDLKEALAEAIS